MPRYRVVEKRSIYNGILIDAESEEAAKQGEGLIVAEDETDSWADKLVSVEQVDDELDAVGPLP
jgi:hypothetical protein